LLLFTSIVGSLVLTLAVLFPVQLAERFTYEAAASATPTPEWYFLWAYQVLKFSVFEGQVGIRVALALLLSVMAVFVLLPFVDRSHVRDPRLRPVYVTLGAIAIVEVFALTIWGSMTAGMTIPTAQAVLVLGSSAIVTACIIFIWHRQLTPPPKLLYERFLSRTERQSIPRVSSNSAARDKLGSKTQ
jgi:quinol-cytochrome oxidoreductase complex cytochrome b subunit